MVVLVVQFGHVIPHSKALGLLILIISVFDQFHDVASWHGTYVKRTVEIGAVALWYQFLLDKNAWSVNIAKALFPIVVVKNPHILPCFVTFLRHNFINIHVFWLLTNFEPIISPVNRDILFDWVNFIMEPLRVSVFVRVCLIWLMDA